MKLLYPVEIDRPWAIGIRMLKNANAIDSRARWIVVSIHYSGCH